MREKRQPFTDADEPDEDEEPSKRPRTHFVELQPSARDPADGIDDEIPGSARADVEPLVLGGRPYHAHEAGDPGRTAGRLAADPGFARAQRAHLRRQQQEQGALAEALQAQEGYDQPEEARNEVGEAVEPFHLRRELEEGAFDPSGNYLQWEREEEGDAWLDSIQDEMVAGVGPDSSRRLPYPNEPVAEPPPLRGAELARFRLKLVELLQPGESVPAALRRLAGGGPVLDKFGAEEARQFYREQVRSGRAVPPGNFQEFQALTEAAEVLFDHGQTGVYTSTREELAAYSEGSERSPAAAPPRAAAVEAAASAGATAAGSKGLAMDAPSVPGPGGHGRRHRAPPTASPAAAAEPPISPDMPSVPSSQHTAATTRGGAGVQAAALGFAAQVPADVSAEAATLAPPVEARWHGPRHTRLLSSHAALLWRKAAAALPYPSPVVPFPDWLNDNSDGRPASLQVEQGLGQPNSAPTAVELGSRARQAAPPPAAGGQTAAAASEHAGRGFEAAGMREGEPDDEQLEAAFQEGLAGRGRAGSASARPAGGPAGASGAPLPPSEAAAVALLGEVVVRDHTDGLAATLAGRLGSVQRLAQQEGAPAVQNAAHAKPAGVAFDNEAANLAGSMPSVAADPDMEE